MSHPRSPRSYLWVASAALLLGCLVLLTWLGTRPSVPQMPVKTAAVPRPVPKPVTPSRTPPPAFKSSSTPDRRAIDPDIQRLADELASKTLEPARDLEIVNEFVGLYSKVFQGNPIGGNEDITAVLTGANPRKGILFPPNSPLIVKGQLVDRWGTPYWFHPSSSTHMEIRSAGPDKSLFTSDDIVINPGPDNMGIGVAQSH